jgi:hypothetical protein
MTKKQSRNRNALVHGLYSKDVLLPWESREDFEKLHEDLQTEFQPHGRAEEEAVLDLAFLHWRKQTAWRMFQTALLKDPFTQDILQTGRKSWTGIRKRLRSAAKSERTLLGMFDAKHAQMLSQLGRLQKKLEVATDNQELKLVQDKMYTLMQIIKDHVVPFTQALRQGPNAERSFDSAYAPECIEKIVRLEAALDARIAKVLARLVGLKEFKRTPAGAAGIVALTDSRTAADQHGL